MTVILSPLSPLTLFITKKNRYKKTYFFSMSLDVTLHNADDTNEKKRGKKMGEKKKCIVRCAYCTHERTGLFFFVFAVQSALSEGSVRACVCGFS